ncbi:hypothetical protein BC938DRAFT_474483 [Jimgerdemannia flammicorona]|uniref:Endonuclease/exonuclease/phosphatase n=1 Tax=Jimgerdemannia flammicorona TaxID=994334 RepID=A0A433QSH1_9FUNG|nr:hypothetical protein BC938DRAFT_474483 [Jimgerdemannia flammicorona]
MGCTRRILNEHDFAYCIANVHARNLPSFGITMFLFGDFNYRISRLGVPITFRFHHGATLLYLEETQVDLEVAFKMKPARIQRLFTFPMYCTGHIYA